MNAHAAGWVKGLLKYGVGFGLLAWVVASNWDGKPGSGAPGLGDLIRRPVNVAALVGVLVLYAGAIAVQITRWYLLVRALDLPFSYRNALRLGLVGTFYNTFLPGAVGGDLIKAYFIAKDSPARKAAAVATVAADRLIGLFGLILYVAVVGGACWLAGDDRIRSNDYLQYMVRTTAAIVGAVVVGWLLLGLLSTARADRLTDSLRAVPRVGNSLAELWQTVWIYRQRPRAILLAVAMSAAAHTAFVVAFDLAARTFPPDNPAMDIGTLPEHFVTVPLGLIAQALFPAPGGVGGGEAVFGWLYQDVLGKPAASGIVGSLVVRLCVWALGLVGYVAYLRMRTELPVESGVQSPPAPGGSLTVGKIPGLSRR